MLQGRRDRLVRLPLPLAGGIDPNRAAVRGNALGVKDLQTMLFQQGLQTVQRVVAQVLVINRVVLQRLDKGHEIVRLRNKHAIVVEQLQDGAHDLMNVLDVRENVRRRDDLRLLPLLDDLFRNLTTKVGLNGRDAAIARDLTDVFRRDPLHLVLLLKVAQEVAVVGADIDNQVLGFQVNQRGTLLEKLGEIVAQDLGCAARVGIFLGKQHMRIHDAAELNEVALLAPQQLRRIARLFRRLGPDDGHRVHRRQVTKEQDRIQIVIAAGLAFLHHHARAGAAG